MTERGPVERSHVILQGNDPYVGASFSLGNRIRRGVWSIVYASLFRPTPRVCHWWRLWLLRLFGAEIGVGCHVQGSVRIWAPWNLVLGDYVGIGERAILYSMDRIVIGDYATISQGAHLCGGTHDYNSENFQLVARPIAIGERAWICAEAFVLPGVSVPEGAVIGARAVVTADPEEPWGVYAGNPAVMVGRRRVVVPQGASDGD